MSKAKRSRYPGLRKPGNSRCWAYRFTGPDGRRRSVSTGEEDVGDAWQRALELRRQAKEAAADKFARFAPMALAEHLDGWRTSLVSLGRCGRHVEAVMQQVRDVLAGCKFKTWPDIDLAGVEAYIARMRTADAAGKRRAGARTRNGYRQSVGAFCRWMVGAKRARENPLAFLKREGNQGADVRHGRRGFEPDELRVLLAFTEPDRAKLYRMAAETGLRASELRSVTWGALDLDGNPPTVTVEAAYCKNGEARTVPLRPRLAAILGLWRTQRASEGSGVRVFPMAATTRLRVCCARIWTARERHGSRRRGPPTNAKGASGPISCATSIATAVSPISTPSGIASHRRFAAQASRSRRRWTCSDTRRSR